MRTHLSSALVGLVLLLSTGFPQVVAADPVLEKLRGLDMLLGPQDAALVSDAEGRILFSKHADKKLVPASTLKILTALAALNDLGPDYRFPTEFYLDDRKNLYVKGFGDPLLISEVVKDIAESLSTRIGEFNDLVLDISYFENPLVIPGITSSFEPYDAPNGALCVNFNTVYVTQDPTGDIVSAEPQTPLLPVVLTRINTSGAARGRVVLSSEKNEFVRYAGHLITYFLKQAGIQPTGALRIHPVQDSRSTLIHRYSSIYPLTEVVSKLMTHSNNFMANQLLIAAGAHAYGPPGSLEKGIRAVSAYAADHLGLKSLVIAEGSGISRENRMTAEQMNRLLDAFAAYRHLLPKHDGTCYKTGTLQGIQTRAGYVDSKHGDLYRFVVFLNTPGTPIGPIMDRIEDALR